MMHDDVNVSVNESVRVANENDPSRACDSDVHDAVCGVDCHEDDSGGDGGGSCRDDGYAVDTHDVGDVEKDVHVRNCCAEGKAGDVDGGLRHDERHAVVNHS